MYFIIVSVAVAVFCCANALFNLPLFEDNVWYVILAVVGSTIAVIVIDAIFATIIRHCLPSKWFNPDKKLFYVSKKEQHFYEKLGIRKWKDKTLELGIFTGFRKNKMQDSNSLEYIERFLLENNYGVMVHVACCIVGFAVIFVCPLNMALYVGLPVAIVNLLLNAMSACILRYNTPKLQTIRKYMLRKQAREVQVEEEEDIVAEQTA